MTQEIDARLDALFQTEKVEAKTFQQLLEEAELFTADYDPELLTKFFKETALAKLTLAAESRVLKAVKRSTKLGVGEARAMLAQAKGKHTSSDEDFGRQLCVSTLERHFAKGQHITRIGGTYMVYTGKFWERRTEDQLAWYVSETLLAIPNPDNTNHSGAITQALNLLRAVCSRPDDPFSLMTDPPNIINTQNGELWVQPDGTVSLKSHEYTSYLLSVLEVQFDPFAACPMYDAAVKSIFANTKEPDEMVRHWHEFVGYVIQTERDIPSWWLLKGQGQNGKTKLMETVMKLLGPTGTATMKIEDLGERFAISDLIGKKMMLEEDMNKSASLPDGILKSISERKVMTGEYKGRDRFAFVCRAVPVMLSNHFPRTNDFSHGMLRRANVIPFTRQFRDADQDATLFPRIWAAEMPGVLNRALQGLQRLRARGHFQPPQDCVRAVDIWSTQANPVKAFVCDALEQSTECRIRWTEVYERFKQWADEENMRFVPGRNTVKREFQTLGIAFKWSVDGHHMVDGYGWKTRDWNKNEDHQNDLI